MFGIQSTRDHGLRIRQAGKNRGNAMVSTHSVDRTARIDHSTADRIGALIVGPADDPHPGRQAQLGGDMRGNRPDHRPRRDRGRQLRAVNPGRFQQAI